MTFQVRRFSDELNSDANFWYRQALMDVRISLTDYMGQALTGNADGVNWAAYQAANEIHADLSARYDELKKQQARAEVAA